MHFIDPVQFISDNINGGIIFGNYQTCGSNNGVNN